MSQPLIDNLPLIAAAPDGINKLRELVLSLAMRGLLVTQDSKDVPALLLLEDIEAEKKSSVKKIKPKRQMAWSLGTSGEFPHELPNGWKWVNIGAIGNIFNGNSINAREKEEKYQGVNGTPYIGTKDVGYGLEPLDYNNGVSIPDAHEFRTAREGAVLICAEGGSAGKKCGITDREICFGNKLFAIELFGSIPSRFILYSILTPFFRAAFEKAMTGIIGGVSIAKFIELPVPLPPLAEQRRIVAKVDELMALCDRLEAQQADAEAVHATLVKTLLDSLIQSRDADDFATNWHRLSQHFPTIFTTEASVDALKQSIRQLAVLGKLVRQNADGELGPNIALRSGAKHVPADLTGHVCAVMEMLSNGLPNLLPTGWQWVTLGDVISFGPQNGISPRPATRVDAPKAITLSATTRGIFDASCFKHVDADIPEESEYWLKPGDLLFQRGNSREYVGMAAYYEGELNNYLYPDLMIKVRLSEVADLRYVHLCAVSPYGREYFSTRASGTSESMPKINQGTLLTFPLPIPSLAEQRRIVAKVDELLALCDTLKAQIAESRKVQRLLATALIDQTLAA